MKNKKIIIIFIFSIIAVGYFIEGVENWPIEEIYPVVAVGYDLDKDLQYSVTLTVYNYKGESEIYSKNMVGVDKNIGDTREERQLKMDKAFKIGSERVMVINRDMATSGIKNILNILVANPEMNDRVLTVVSKDKAVDILRYKVKGYPSSAEYIEGMIKNSTTFNFLSNEYTLLNVYARLMSEGENLVLPYIETDAEGINYLGMSIFNKEKMVYALEGNESKIMNMIREKNGNGVITIQENNEEYLNYKAKVKREVNCNKKDDKYEFVIDLNFNGDVLVNTLYKKIEKDEEKDIEKKLAKNIENMCNSFINKMKNEIKVDCLQLGMYGVAKYGRDTGVDWNEIVCNSNIKVNVKVKLDKTGRGEY